MHFEAVDYQSTVWVNSTQVGTHTGGNLPFYFDITSAIQPGANDLTLRVTDATDTQGAYQLHGKQVCTPKGIWYTPVSGIWQTVWLETVPSTHIVEAKITPSISGKVVIELTTSNDSAADASVTALLEGKTVVMTSGPAQKLAADHPRSQVLVARFTHALRPDDYSR